jgi:small subunit ribosomal protein S2
VVDTNCDPSEVNYVIPGNDDALRAIRLFASKISDSVIEGAQVVTDKQMADIAAGVQHDEAPVAVTAGDSETGGAPGLEPAEMEEVSMEEVLGKTARRVAPAEVVETPSA